MHNSTLLTATGHPPQHSRSQTRRVGFLDRAALRVGVALVTWSRRPFAPESREQRASRVQQQLATLAREEHWSKTRLLRY